VFLTKYPCLQVLGHSTAPSILLLDRVGSILHPSSLDGQLGWAARSEQWAVSSGHCSPGTAVPGCCPLGALQSTRICGPDCSPSSGGVLSRGLTNSIEKNVLNGFPQRTRMLPTRSSRLKELAKYKYIVFLFF
jgi:hypothetical protein